FSLLLLLAMFWNRALRKQVLRRQQAEMRLRALSDQQKAVLHNSPVGIAFIDQNREIRQVNPEMARHFGYKPEELLGRTTQIFFSNEADFIKFGERAYPSLRNGEVYEEELFALRLDKKGFWCHLRGVAINKMNLDEGFVWITEDISSRREIGKKLEQTKEAAEQANRSKTLFLAHMSHEIRTPLNAILGMNEILIDSPLSNEQKKHLKTAKNAGETLLSLINDILDLSKIEAEQMDLAVIDFNLPKLIENTADIQHLAASEKGISFKVNIDPTLPRHVKGDPDRIRQILLNLLNNAIKFTLSGSVVFSAHQKSNNRVKFTVRDTGIGMTNEQVAQIFKPFVQASNLTTHHFGGTGLGLTICKKLVDTMGGSVNVESKINEGSIFSIILTLPPSILHRQQEIPTSLKTVPTPIKDKPAKKSLTILLVDDAEENRMVISAYLKHSPHRIIETEHGAEALALFRKKSIDLILMDMLMPVMDGYEATRNIRKHEKKTGSKPVPIIALTAQALREDLEKTIAAGCDFYLTKPVRKTQLIEAINRFRQYA
ncbi:MAG: response regulator, partial [Magnetococcales bacterium]|nr:response regulator [Magnetococcales bacterium]